MTMRGYCVLAAALILGVCVAAGFSATTRAGEIVSGPTVCVVEGPAVAAPWFARPRVVLPRAVFPRAVYATPVYTAPRVATRVVESYIPQSTVVFEQRPAEPVTIIEQPRDPVVIRGLFTDRVRMPRGKQITVVK